MGLAVFLSAALAATTVLMHYEGLRRISLGVPRLPVFKRAKVIVIMFGVIILHLLEIALYAVGYWFGDVVIDIGDFTGHAVTFRDYMYFSIETYTTLGIGDAYPVDSLRLIASIESLNGLLLLGWSASFIYLEMQKYWDSDAPARGRGSSADQL